MLKGNTFAGIHVFSPDSDIPDNQELRLAVITPLAPHYWKQKTSEAVKLITKWSPLYLNSCLDMWYWRGDRQEVLLSALWDDFCSYPYLPRLLDAKVLCSTVGDGVRTKDYFGYADGKEGDRYLGLLFGRQGTVHMDKNSLIVHKDAAGGLLEREKSPESHTGMSGESAQPEEPEAPGQQPGPMPPVAPKITNFHGRVDLSPLMLAPEASSVAGEVVQHFTSKYGARVSVTLEIDAHLDEGFPDSLVRTVSENCKTLKFNLADFEGE